MIGTSASMEGRAIARPNTRNGCHSQIKNPRFNGGPGNCPAKPRGEGGCGGMGSRFNGGPGNCPAKLGTQPTPPAVAARFNGGPGNCPAKPVGEDIAGITSLGASMEGRAIARPNEPAATHNCFSSSALQWRAGQLPGQTGVASASCKPGPRASMEGRAIARPNKAGGVFGPQQALASMEGRAIARPNWMTVPGTGFRFSGFNGGPGNCPAKPTIWSSVPTWCHGFNGGPGNCPAKRLPDGLRAGAGLAASMEGRAIARPNCAVGGCRVSRLGASMEGRAIARPNMCSCGETRGAGAASMEGRAIARPNPSVDPLGMRCSIKLQWRAGQLPGQTLNDWTPVRHCTSLQWRAGQLPGQTRRRRRRARSAPPSFNGGPGNCPAKPRRRRGVHRAVQGASMEGRAIARPNHRRHHRSRRRPRWLQWRAGQLPGQTVAGCATMGCMDTLQWRAGQLPGQTFVAECRPPDWEMLQWRAGQLPGQTQPQLVGSQDEVSGLQWRAGQLPGQTPRGRRWY